MPKGKGPKPPAAGEITAFGVDIIKQYPGQEQVDLSVLVEIPGSWFGGALTTNERRDKYEAQTDSTAGSRCRRCTAGSQPAQGASFANMAGWRPKKILNVHGRLGAPKTCTAGWLTRHVHGRRAALARPAGCPSTLLTGTILLVAIRRTFDQSVLRGCAACLAWQQTRRRICSAASGATPKRSASTEVPAGRRSVVLE